VLALAVSATVPTGVPQGSIDDVIDREMPASGVPGLAYAVVSEGTIASVSARGVVRKGGDTKVTPDTPFLTGSVSKSFTALAVMQLVEAGRVDLDAALESYLQRFSAGPPAPSRSGSCSATPAATPPCRATPRTRI
jgi:CubicO group peptidase (beta-lactamase class C family)